MLKALLAIPKSAWSVELLGAGLIVAGIAEQWGSPAAPIAAGVAFIIKAVERELLQ